MAIKRPNISKPGIVKPNMGKKAPVKPVVEEPKVVNEEVVEVVVEKTEEVVNEIEIPIEEVVEEEIEVPEDMIQTPPQIIEKEESKQEEIVVEEAAVEEVIEEVKEEIIEEPKKKTSKKRSSKKAKKDEPAEEIPEEANEQQTIKDYKAKPLVDAMKSMIGITGCTTPEWEQTKANIIEQVEGMHIDPDSTPAEMRYLIADIDAALSQLKIYKINADQQFNPLLKHINYVSLQAGSKGSNSEERKANAIRGLIEYKANPDDIEYTNLLDIQVFAENQIAFYDEMIKILQDKKNMLITFSGIVKTETQLGGY